MAEPDTLIFYERPTVEFATNTFSNVSIILQYEDTPLIEVVKLQEAGFTTRFSIYHEDGTYLAKVVGSRLFADKAGKKAGVKLEFPPLMTVCKLGNGTLFEIRRKEAAALKTKAELYTPDGAFVKGTDAGLAMLRNMKNVPLRCGTATFRNCTWEGFRIGLHMRQDGRLEVAVT